MAGRESRFAMIKERVLRIRYDMTGDAGYSQQRRFNFTSRASTSIGLRIDNGYSIPCELVFLFRA